MKELFKSKLMTDEYCANMLEKFKEKGISFEDLWDKKINSAVSSFFIYIS